MALKGKTEKSKTQLRYEHFAREYVVDLNGTRAAIAAGYSEKTAESMASHLLRNHKVKNLISGLIEKRAAKLELSADKVLRELSLLGFANMTDYIVIGKDGSARVDLSKVDRDKGAAIQEVTVEEYSERTGTSQDGKPTFETVKRIKFKLADKGQNLERLGRHLKLFTDKVEFEGSVDGRLSLDQLNSGIAELLQRATAGVPKP